MFGIRIANDLNHFHQQLEQIFSAFESGRVLSAQPREIEFRVKEQPEAYVLEADLPGLNLEQLDISVLGRQLSVAGEFEGENLPEGARWLQRERSGGSFKRTLHLSDKLDPERVDAEYRQGVLSLKIAKAEAELPKKIAVQMR